MRYYLVVLLLFAGLSLQAGVGGQLRQAGKLYANEQYGQALSAYEQALQQDPQNAKAAFGAGAAAYQLKDYQQAQQAFESVSHEKKISDPPCGGCRSGLCRFRPDFRQPEG